MCILFFVEINICNNKLFFLNGKHLNTFSHFTTNESRENKVIMLIE